MTFADRYARLANRLGGEPDPDDPAQVLAMPIVLHIEKTDPPCRRHLLQAAARAAVALCLDERSDPDGPWGPNVDRWSDARIRKISRRARGAHWTAAQDVPGVTVDERGASARAIVPGPVGEVDRRIDRLQIGGTDLRSSEPGNGHTTTSPMTLWVNPGLEMTVGKLAAQVGHGSMLGVGLFDTHEALRWWRAGCPLRVLTADRPRWDALAVDDGGVRAVQDAGFTEVAPGSTTVIAQRTGDPPVPRTDDPVSPNDEEHV